MRMEKVICVERFGTWKTALFFPWPKNKSDLCYYPRQRKKPVGKKLEIQPVTQQTVTECLTVRQAFRKE